MQNRLAIFPSTVSTLIVVTSEEISRIVRSRKIFGEDPLNNRYKVGGL